MTEHKDSKECHRATVNKYYHLGRVQNTKPTESSRNAFTEMPYKLKTTPSNEDLGVNPYQE